MRTHYETLGVARDATPAVVKAAFQAQMKALEGSGLPEAERGAREKMLRVAFITLFDPAGKSRYDKQLTTANQPAPPKPPTPAKAASFHPEPVAPHEVASKNPVVMVGVVAAVAVAIAGGWYVTHPSPERLERMRKETDTRHKASRERLETAPVNKNPNPFRNTPDSEAKDRMIKQAIERDAKAMEKEAQGAKGVAK